MHLIHRQIVELECSSEQRALHWQQELVRICENRLTPELERVLERFADSKQVIQIEQLSLDLGTLNSNDFQESFVSAVLKQLPKQLEESIKSLDINNISKGHHNAFETFTYFLKHGTLPWWSGPVSLAQIAEEVLEQANLISQNQAVTQLREALQSRQGRERLLLQFGTTFWEKLLQAIVPDRWNLVNNWSDILLQILSEVNISKNQHNKLKHRVTQVILHPEEPEINIFFTKAVHELNVLNEFISQIKKLKKSEKLPPELSAETIHSVVEKLKEAAPAASEDASKSEQETDMEDLTEEGSFISNAGLVLLAPFLLEYLKACEVAEDERLLNKEQAVHYLQYLITGKKMTPEYDLILNKLLCDLPLDAPVPLEIEFSAGALEQADSLLNSVIHYWDVLKNTSVEGLRESFLQRPGKLSRRDDGWLLQVEQQSYDILLEHLPWSYSIVKLPWMPEMLWVEWM